MSNYLTCINHLEKAYLDFSCGLHNNFEGPQIGQGINIVHPNICWYCKEQKQMKLSGN